LLETPGAVAAAGLLEETARGPNIFPNTASTARDGGSTHLEKAVPSEESSTGPANGESSVARSDAMA
jgi:hypothetical protein